ncbi:transmembrane protein 252-like [Hypomesus transpacificus]|uniref:transmembrane protein 252-like n=1 Tax=Hypomesus transpacificus TaxID=137520 RepID=UPI001F087BDD|nr:transmembrane protein 252-like [Hypomesus transpacificus]
MEARKQLCSLARMALPGLGFGLTCMGAYMTSLEQWDSRILNVVLAYILITCGFLMLLTGVFWAICHNMRHKRLVPNRRHPSAHVHVYTVDRPSFFPPSYAESQHAFSPRLPAVAPDEEAPSPLQAPPLYTLSSSDTPDDSFNHDQPPPYSATDPRGPARQQDQGAGSPH